MENIKSKIMIPAMSVITPDNCPFHVKGYDAFAAYCDGWYLPSWKIEEGLYDEHGFFDEVACDMVMDAKRLWQRSLDHYERIRHNHATLMVYLGVMVHTPHAPSDTRMSKDDVREALELHTVVEAYTPLRKVGQYKYQGACPWHDDRLPSLSVDDKKGMWNCFAGCGGGDVFAFIMKARKCSFYQALDVARTMV